MQSTNLLKVIEKVLKNGQFILGKKGEELEKKIKKYVGLKHAVGVGNGTDALYLSLKALGIGPGDEVITTPFTFIAPAEAIAQCGATPVFVDINYRDFLISPQEIERHITEKTKAIVPVHLFGQCCDMKEIMEIADDYGLFVVEDGAQAFGTKGLGKGHFLTFSFHPSKSLGCCGDGGMILTNYKALAKKVKLLRNHGAEYHQKYLNHVIGFNSRLDEIQAAILLEKLKTFEKDGIKRLFTFRTPNRKLLQRWLDEKGLDNKIYYSKLLHFQPCFQYLGYKKGDFPVAEQAAKEVLTVNIYE